MNLATQTQEGDGYLRSKSSTLHLPKLKQEGLLGLKSWRKIGVLVDNGWLD